jgi:hypothetical protein
MPSNALVGARTGVVKHSESGALLRGKLFDDKGNAMSPSSLMIILAAIVGPRRRSWLRVRHPLT